MGCLDLIPGTILACCVLHNICLQEIEDDVDIINYIDDGNEILDEAELGVELDYEREDQDGVARMDNIAAFLRREE